MKTRELIEKIQKQQQARFNGANNMASNAPQPPEYVLLSDALGRLQALDYAIGEAQRNTPGWSGILSAANDGRLKVKTEIKQVYVIEDECAEPARAAIAQPSRGD